MKVLKILGIIVLIIAASALGLIIFGPSEGHLERQVTINAPAEVVFADVSNLKSFNKWSPWFKVDPNAEYVFEGPASGIGAKMTWYSEDSDLGNGYMEITETREGEFVGMDMGFDQNNNRDFTDEGEERPVATFVLNENEDGTLVTWTFDISGVSGFEKMMVVGLDMFLGPFYEEGLAALKERVESRPEMSVKISVEDVISFTFAGKEVTSANDSEAIAKIMESSLSDVMSAITSNSLQIIDGYPFALVTNYDENNLSMIYGIPVAETSVIEGGDIAIMKSPGGIAIRALHFGDYAVIEETHDQIDSYAKYYGYEITGYPWEIYVTNPNEEPDTTKWVTEVYYPVK